MASEKIIGHGLEIHTENRRFIASVAAMQGILSGNVFNDFLPEGNSVISDLIADMAVKCADALIAELDKGPR